MAQRACVMERAPLAVDNVLGPSSMAALDWAAASGIENFLHLRQARYESIAYNHPAEAKYLPGWTNRNDALMALVGVILTWTPVAPSKPFVLPSKTASLRSLPFAARLTA